MENSSAQAAEIKRTLRPRMMQQRDQLAERAQLSEAICGRLAGLQLFQQAQAIHCYLPMRSEVDTGPLLQRALAAGKRVAVPIVVRGAAMLGHSWIDDAALRDLATGVFGTPQPQTYLACDPADCDLIIVPLLAFDRNCQRLGYGKGHYDRLLMSLRKAAVGVAFAAQELPTLPAERYDVALSAVVTEGEVIWGTRR